MTKRTEYPPAPEYPFSDELCDFMDKQPKFFKSLKLANDDRFLMLPIIAITQLPAGNKSSQDQVIGVFYLDKVNLDAGTEPYFKQDYIVNIEGKNNEFVSYSAKNSDGNYVKPLADFFDVYGQNGRFYNRATTKPWEHHYNDVDDLPDYPGLKEAGQQIKNNA